MFVGCLNTRETINSFKPAWPIIVLLVKLILPATSILCSGDIKKSEGDKELPQVEISP